MLNNFEFTNIVNLKNIEYNENIVETIPDEIQVSDSFQFSYDGEGLEIIITRKVWFTPVSLFDVSITAVTYLQETPNSNYNGKKISNDDFIREFEPVLSNMCSRISSIISIITMTSQNAPLITLPQLITDEL